MSVLHIDIETRSTLDLKAVGAARYAEHPTTDVWVLAYAVGGDGPVQLWHRGDPVPAVFFAAANHPDWEVKAHNAGFDRTIFVAILALRYGFPLIPIERWRCTMAKALACALPGKLEMVAEVLGLEHRKDADGARLMRLMAKPRKSRKGEDPNAGPYWHDEPENIERLDTYVGHDVETMRALDQRLSSLSDSEQQLEQLDATINDRGFFTDGALLEAAARLAATVDPAMQDELTRLTDGAVTSTDQLAKLQAWLAGRGCDVKDGQKATLKAALRRQNLDPVARRVIELRLAAAFDTKVGTMLARRCADGRIRGTLQFHGAATGRWAARGVQVQNFTRDPGDIDAKIAAIMAGDLGGYPQPLSAIADAARGAIAAAPLHRFLIGDLSGVESRVLAWVAGQANKVAQWRKFDETGNPLDEPYFITGLACGMAPERARQGKYIDLAFGYMGGIAAYAGTTYEGDPSTEAEREQFKKTWRRLNSAIVAFWYDTDRAAIKAARSPGSVHSVKCVSFKCVGDFLELTLPSGRIVRYPFPRIATNRFDEPCVIFKDTAFGKWADCNYGRGAYGGLWTENIVQAISRDLLAAAMQRLEAAGYPIVLTVHDEIVCEVPNGFGSLEEFKRLFIAAPDWAAGLPIAAKVREGLRFNKPTDASAPTIVPNEDQEADSIDTTIVDEAPAAVAPDSCVDELELTMPTDEAPPLAAADVRAEAKTAGGTIAAGGLAAANESAAGFTFEPAPPPTWEQIRAAFARRPDEAPGRGNGHDKGNGHSDDGAWAGDDHDGYPPRGKPDRDTGSQVAFYTYHHADGQPYLGVKRTTTKAFPQYHWTGTAWVKGAPAGLKIPYRLPELIRAPPDAWVLICAGEKDADSAATLGFTATTNPEGERKGAWVPELNAWFAGRKRVAIMEDNDKTGQAHVLEVANALRGVVPDIRIVTFRELPEHCDLTDWLEQGHGKAELLARIETAKPFYRKPQPAPLRDWIGQPIPQPEYTVPGRILAEQVFIFSGEGGEGKSNMLQQLCSAQCLGAQWLGCTVRRGGAIYLECEDTMTALHWRQAAINQHYGVDYDVLADAGLQLFSMIEHDTILAAPNKRNGILEPTAAYDWLFELAGDTKPVLIGIASTSNVFAGNENERSEVQQFVKLLGQIALVTGGAVILVTHPSMSGANSSIASHEGLSGTTQWHNAVRGRAVMKTVKADDEAESDPTENKMREIKFHKNQYGPPIASSFVRWQNGLFLPIEGVATLDAAERAAKADQVFILLLRRWTEQKRQVSVNRSSTYAPSNFAKQPEAAGLATKDLAAAMERLLRDGLIENRTVSKGKETRSHLAIVGAEESST